MPAMKRCRSALLALTGALVAVAASLVGSGGRPAAGAGSSTERVSVSSAGAQANQASRTPVISGDGRYVVFLSYASNLVAGSGPGIFLRDRLLDTTEIVAFGPGGLQANGFIADVSISADARIVAISTTATNLGGPASPLRQLYIRDRIDQTTEWIGSGFDPAVSADGRFVAFTTTNDQFDDGFHGTVLVYDRVARATELVSLPPAGVQGINLGSRPAISADGRFVAFRACRLPRKSSFQCQYIFVRDRVAGVTEFASIDSWGDPRPTAGPPDISADGRFVAFGAEVALTPDDTDSVHDVFVRDRIAGTTERVSLDPGSFALLGAGLPRMSADGRFVAFRAERAGIFASVPNPSTHVVVRDRMLGTTELVSADSVGQPGDLVSGFDFRDVAISRDGRFIAFGSSATNLVPGDTNGLKDIFLRDRMCVRNCAPPPPPLTTPPPACTRGCATSTATPIPSPTTTPRR
jgi:hypothetical protein